ncbi:zinc finger protein 449-like [Manis pentadactyla]|uniref:zinc finger protein 449-like n=1 Tax=Manis pentadactyla TaxID=143292 RepID=UPI00255C640A|nr:zinc finger protein 449-like [Manis pentadactyla]XP_057351379.1 zinc finger protein 449-like [Manis pentadactyla]
MAVPLGSAMQTLNQGSVLEEYDTDREVFRQRFRQFQYEEAAGPRDAFKKLSELCRQWLKPNLGCLEEILEVLVLEQLMQILPIEIQNCTRQFSMKNREALFSLIEFLQTKTDVSEQQVDRQEVLLEALAPVGTAHIPPDIHLESPPVQVMGPAPEAPVAEACIPQGGPQELSYGAAGECQPFLDPGCSWPIRDLRLPKGHQEEPWEKEFHDPKEGMAGLHGSVIDGNGPNSPKHSEELKSPLGTPAEQLPWDGPVPVHDESPSLGEAAESSSREGPLSPRPQKQESPGDLIRHHPGHTEEMPFECAVCKRRFRQRSSLVLHLKTYSGQETYQCHECSMIFCSRVSFIRHLRIHTDGKPHICQSCGKCFRRRRDLTVHQVTHTDERPFLCEYCGKMYRQKSSLSFHLKKPHRVEAIEVYPWL